MSFLEIVPSFSVPIKKATRQIESVGRKKQRSFRGKMQSGERGKRPSFSLETCFREYDDSNTFRQLVHGRGEVFYFRDGLQGSKGTMPKRVSSSALGFDLSLAAPFDGFIGGGIETDDPSGFLVYDMQTGNDATLNDEWTVLWLEYNRGDSAWHRSAKRSDGKFVFDGVQNDSQWLTGADAAMEWQAKVFDGLLTMQGSGMSGGVLHHMVLLPFLASDSLIDAFMVGIKPWGPLPLLRVEGDIVTEDHAFMFGESKSAAFVRASDGVNGQITNQLDVKFMLEYAASGFYADDTVPSQGSIIAPPKPVIPQIGAFSALYNSTGDAPTFSFAGLAERDEAAPATVDVNRPAALNNYAMIVSQKEDGQLAFVRTISSQQANTGGFALSHSPVDGSVVIGGSTSRNSISLEVRDEANAVLATISRPDALSGTWAWYVSFDDIGAVNWAFSNTYSQAATDSSWQSCWVSALAHSSDGRLFMAGGIRKLPSKTSLGGDLPDGDCVPVIGGLSYPPITTNINKMSGIYVTELDPLNGSAIAISASDNIACTSAAVRSYVHAPGIQAGIYLAIDPDGQHIHLTGNYTGNDSYNDGFIQIGRNSSNPITTRVFSSWSGGDEGKPFIAKMTLDFTPVAVVTSKIPVNTNQKSFPSRPAVNNAKVYFAWQEPINLNASNTNRDQISYASNVATVNVGNGSGNIQSMPKSDYEDPRIDGFNSGFYLPTSGQQDASKLSNLYVMTDENILGSLSSRTGNSSGTWTFLDDASPDTFFTYQSMAMKIDGISGSLIWKAKERPKDSGSRANAVEYIQFSGGAKSGRIYSVAYFSTSLGLTNYGAESSDGSLGYNVKGSWAETMNLGGGCFIVVVRDENGLVIPSECYPLASFSTAEAAQIIAFGVK